MPESNHPLTGSPSRGCDSLGRRCVQTFPLLFFYGNRGMKFRKILLENKGVLGCRRHVHRLEKWRLKQADDGPFFHSLPAVRTVGSVIMGGSVVFRKAKMILAGEANISL